MSGAVAETVAGETVERKLDPEALAIRARPIRAIRFKRGLIVGLAGAAVLVLVIIAWFALKPHVFRVVAQPEAVAEPEARPPVDALGTLPKTYGDVPRLGPPLPGDLGKPILEQQQAAAFAAQGGGNVAAQAAQAERERRSAELKAARQSGLLVQNGQRAEGVSATMAAVEPAVGSGSDAGKVALIPSGTPTASNAKPTSSGGSPAMATSTRTRSSRQRRPTCCPPAASSPRA